MRPATPSDPPTQTLEVDGRPAAVTDEGAGPPLLAVHGLPGSCRDWRWLAPCLTDQLRLIRVDQPGFGGTPLATMPDPDVLARADWLLKVADALELDRFCVVGHSFGGGLALALAARAPGRVTALALLASVGVRPHPVHRRSQAFFSAAVPLLRTPGIGRVMRGLNRRIFERLGFRGHDDVARTHTVAICARADFAAHRAWAGRITAPTLVAWCEDDAQVAPAITRELAALLPEGPRLAFPTGGHNLQKTQAIPLSEALVPWLRGHAERDSELR